MTITTDRPTTGSYQGATKVDRSPVDLFAAAIALVLPIAAFSNLETGVWALRAALLLIVAAVGLPILLSQALGKHSVAARAAVAFLVVGSASALVSSNHTTAVFGLYDQGTGLLFMVSLAAAWAIGRRVRPQARPLVERALLVGIFVNVGVALLSSVFDLASVSPWLGVAGGRTDGRIDGLSGNPVHLAALAVLALALVVPRFMSAPALWALPAAATAAAAQVSGTRAALIVMVGVAIWAGRRHGLRVAVMLGVVLLLGFAAGTAIESSAIPSQSTATGRADQIGSLSNRPATWLSAWPSVVEHPLLGVGPGQFRTAISPRTPISVARTESAESLFTDAHNLFVEYLTTTGLLGLAALVVWLAAAVRTGRGWLFVGAFAILVIGLLEPQSVVTTPLAFLALGASGAYDEGPQERRRSLVNRLVPACLVAVAVVAASMFLYGEFQVTEAQRTVDVTTAQQAARFLPAWPRTATLQARAWLLRAATHGHDSADHQRSRAWLLTAVRRDNTDPWLWNDLAEFDENLGTPQDAQAEFTAALRFDPTSVRAMDGLARLAHDACNPSLERYWLQRASQISPAVPGRTPAPEPWQTTVPSCASQRPG